MNVWKTRYGDDDARRTYMRSYYSKNKDKFAKYREDFRLKFPGYHKEYARKRKELNTDGVLPPSITL